jgi:hypothetical protein
MVVVDEQTVEHLLWRHNRRVEVLSTAIPFDPYGTRTNDERATRAETTANGALVYRFYQLCVRNRTLKNIGDVRVLFFGQLTQSLLQIALEHNARDIDSIGRRVRRRFSTVLTLDVFHCNWSAEQNTRLSVAGRKTATYDGRRCGSLSQRWTRVSHAN